MPGLLADSRHCLQKKYDGRRLMVRKIGDAVTGIDRAKEIDLVFGKVATL